MKLATASEMAALDRYAIDQIGIPSLVLMERAALGCVEALPAPILSSPHPACLVAGPGNNGGDALAIARLLSEKGKPVRLYRWGDEAQFTPDNRHQASICERLGIFPIALTEGSLGEFLSDLERCDVVIDGLLGIGLKREVSGFLLDIIQGINLSQKPVLSIDTPSGLHADRGIPFPIAVQATWTVACGLAKIGHFMDLALEFVGELQVADIGISRRKSSLLTSQTVDIIPPTARSLATHKGHFGRSLIIAGSAPMSGAPVLAAKAALRAGAGWVTLAVPEGIRDVVAGAIPQAIVHPLPMSAEGTIDASALPLLQSLSQQATAIAIGPGLGQSDGVRSCLQLLLASIQKSLILDADALNNLSANELTRYQFPLLITPHPGELARLLSLSAGEIQGDRWRYARASAAQWQATVLLKGARSVIAERDGQTWVNTHGNPALAKAGSGDILTGLCVSLVAQGRTMREAACEASHLLGQAAEYAVRDRSERSVTAEDLIGRLT